MQLHDGVGAVCVRTTYSRAVSFHFILLREIGDSDTKERSEVYAFYAAKLQTIWWICKDFG